MPFDHGNITCRVCLLPKDLPADVLKRFEAILVPTRLSKK